MLSNELTDFLKFNFPNSWQSWQRKKNHPTPESLIGRTLKSITSGYGGHGGQLLKVTGYQNGSLVLKSNTRNDHNIYTTPFELEVRYQGILDNLVPNLPIRRAWYKDFEVLPESIVVLLRGVPGSGKTTLAKKLQDPEKQTFAQFTRISADDTKGRGWTKKLTEAIERKDKYIVLDRCHSDKKQRQRPLHILRDYGDRVFTIVLTLPIPSYEVLEERIKKDEDHSCPIDRRIIAMKSHLQRRNEDNFNPEIEGWDHHIELQNTDQLGELWRVLRALK